MTSTTPLRVSVDQAAMTALCAVLTAGLPSYSYDTATSTDSGVLVSDRWPEADRALPGRAVTVLRAGDPREESTQPAVVGHLLIHSDLSPRVRIAAPTDLATCIAALNACRTSYETHRLSTAAHQAADTINAISAPVATDAPSAALLADDLRAVLAAHLRSGAHANPDAYAALAAVRPVASSSLSEVSAAVLAALSAHYAARIYLWRIADVEQPIQLDVWATDDVGREDVMARLVDVLHGASGTSDDPACEYLTLTLSGEWEGVTAEVSFAAPSVIDDADSHQRNEYRATYRGTLALSRIVRAQSPRMTRAQLLITTDSGHSASATVALVGATTATTIVP